MIQVVLLCGGRGERLRPLTDTCQKCLLPVGGKPFMDRVIEEYANHDLKAFILIMGYLGEQIHEAYSEWGKWRGIHITLLNEGRHGGTVNALRTLLDTGFDANRILLANGDTLVQTDTRPQNFSGKALGFRIGQQDCGLRLFRTDVLISTMNSLEHSENGQKIEYTLFPLLPLKWQNLNKDSSRFIDIGTPENYERAKVIFR